MNYDGKIFKPIQTTKNSETTNDTVFRYKQGGNILTSEYFGGSIKKGQLIGIVSEDGTIEIRYQQVNFNNELMTGVCISKPEFLPNGKIRLHEKWKWTSGDHSEGESLLEEQ
ncbi:n-acetylglutamate synthase [Winogradskyella sp. PE311]|uniref:n-acetylglutamate synthase n=1 Tax=Winogradskyella sp. PE311 TaxID=3366943 RepID=UPI0039816F33